MLYLLAKILIFLLIAAMIGFINGWYLRQNLPQKKTFLALDENKKLKAELKRCLETANQETIIKKDNLQKINGIGAVLELKLNQLGIFSFEQISDWNSAEVEKISQNIGSFPNRINRDDWVIQAKELVKKS